jgi:hypothetical protein
MEVTSAAAIDVGGGDRFDLAGNRALGRPMAGANAKFLIPPLVGPGPRVILR